MIYVYAKYQKPTPYIKRDIANVKVFLPRRPAGRTESPLHIDSHCIACESITQFELLAKWVSTVHTLLWVLIISTVLA